MNELKCLFGFHEFELKTREYKYEVFSGQPYILWGVYRECKFCKICKDTVSKFNPQEDAKYHIGFIKKLGEKIWP